MAIRKWVILLHRYLGLVLGLPLLVWFLSGIGMIYAGGMPRVSRTERLERMPPLDVRRVRLSPSEAVARAAGVRGGRILLLTVLDRPAYRFADGETVFADTGDSLEEVGELESLTIASRFLGLPTSALRHVGVLERPDQWTLEQRRALPLHHIIAADAARSEVYVSEQRAEVVVRTTRASRSLAWASAIPHWLYFRALRTNALWWTRTVLWLSVAGIVSSVLGLALAVWQARVRYAGLMRWHYVLGVVFGGFACTWVFSGFLSLQPGDWAASENGAARIPRVLSGPTPGPDYYPTLDADAWARVPDAAAVREVEFRGVQGRPYVVARGPRTVTVLDAESLAPRTGLFPADELLDRMRQAYPDVPVADTTLLADYDAYYYDRERDAPLPVLRVRFGDPDATWVYVDPAMSEVVGMLTRRQRLERWLYHGLHSLDFPFWYFRRPLWDIGMITLLLGGAALSGVGVFAGLKRLGRAAGRLIGV